MTNDWKRYAIMTEQGIMLGNKCRECKHEWVTEHLKVKPIKCPHCKTKYWDEPKPKPYKKNPGNKGYILSDEQKKMLRKIIDEIPDEDIY